MVRIILLVCVLVVGMSSPVFAERRALVIGNDVYAELSDLEKARNDAASMADALTPLGFTVTDGTDLDRRAMNRLIARFVASLSPGDEALVFYAGHGIALDGENFLLPTDTPLSDSKVLVKSEAIAVSRLLAQIREAGAGVTLAIIDACRNDPFTQGTRRAFGTRGLAPIDPQLGTFVLFSAGAGQEARDRLTPGDPDPNSVFMRHFLPVMKTPGIELRDMVRQVRGTVAAAARTVNHAQFPAYYDELKGDFFFAGVPTETAPVETVSEDRIAQDYERAERVGTAGAWRAFLSRHGRNEDDFYVILARETLAGLEEVAIAPVPIPVIDVEPEPEEWSEPEIDPMSLRMPTETECDHLAADPDDPAAMTAGIPFLSIEVGDAIRACEAAISEWPGEDRFWYQLGRAYDRDLSMDSANRAYRHAADRGHGPALFALGLNAIHGRGQPRDPVLGSQFLLRAVEAGYGPAATRLAVDHEMRGQSADVRKARVSYETGAELGHAQAMFALSQMMNVGAGGDRDAAAAGYWAAEAIRNGDPFARDAVKNRPEWFRVDTRRALQEQLRSAGHYRGPIDGDFGPGTRAAVDAHFDSGD